MIDLNMLSFEVFFIVGFWGIAGQYIDIHSKKPFDIKTKITTIDGVSDTLYILERE